MTARGGARLIEACQGVEQAYAVSHQRVSEGARARGADGSPSRGGSGDARVALDRSEGSRAMRCVGRGAPSSCGAWSNWGTVPSPPRAARAPSSTASTLKEVVLHPVDLLHIATNSARSCQSHRSTRSQIASKHIKDAWFHARFA